jgi:hypothetical protein
MGGAHCVNLSAHVLSFCIPGSAFAALTAAGLTTNLPLAGQAIRYAVNGYICRWAKMGWWHRLYLSVGGSAKRVIYSAWRGFLGDFEVIYRNYGLF